MIRAFTASAITALLLGAAPPADAVAPAAIVPVRTEAPAGAYRLDPAHASLTFRVDHLGFSFYSARFTRFDASLDLDPANPAAASVTASVDPASLTLDNPPPGFLEHLLGPDFLDAATFPTMTFRSTRVELTGPDTARIHGDFTLHGVTRPLVLEARFNGGYAGHPMDPHGRIGFSAHGTISRSAHGIAYGVPQPGSKMGVGDAVEVAIEAEFTGPAWKRPAGGG